MSSLADLTQELDDGTYGKNNDAEPIVYGDAESRHSPINRCANCLTDHSTCGCCNTASALCISANVNFRPFMYLVIVAFLWSIMSIVIVSVEKNNHWEEFETLFEKPEMDYERNMTKTLIRTTMAISLQYTESMSLFYVFFNLVSSVLYGSIIGMLIQRYGDMYAVNKQDQYAFNNDVMH